MKYKLDIALLTAGQVGLFDKCVEALLPELRPDYQVHVCNNGFPSKEYEEIYRKLPSDTVIKRMNTNNGFGGGANTAIRSGSAPLVLFITDDVFVHPDTMSKLVKTMDEQTIALCGYKLLFPLDSVDPTRPAGKVQHIGMASNIRGDMIHPLIGWSADNPKCCISRDVLAVTGASFIVRRASFQKAGGFSSIFGKGYFEDMDLCFTIRSQGGRIYINADATATHGVGQTMKHEKSPIPIQQNAMLFKSKWLSSLPYSEWDVW
jgi:GT2 family glycosyltransferase